MRILQIGKFYPISGGIEKVMYDIMEGVNKHSIHCDMLCASTTHKSYIVQFGNIGKIICCGTFVKLFSTMISPKMIYTLWKTRNNYDIIHIHHPDPMAVIALFLSGYKKSVVLHWHSDILKQKTMLKLFSPLQKWILKRADIIIGTTPTYIENSYFLKPFLNKAVNIPIGIDKLESDKNIVNDIKREYKNKKIIFSLGRLVEYKGYKYLVESAKYLNEDYIILIGGTGPLKDKLTNLIVDLNLQNKVKLVGRITDEKLPSYYDACDIFCLSSIWKTEAFAIVQIEAMSYGKPIIATKIEGSGVPWVNAHGISGINVSVESPKEIADAVVYLLSDNKRYDTYSCAAMNRYNTLFRKEIMIEKLISIYNSLA